MIFGIDIGNSNVMFGGIDDDGVIFREEIATDLNRTAIEYAIDFKTALEIFGIRTDSVEGSIISSVVPQITSIVKAAALKLTGKAAKVVGPGLKTGLNIRIDDPATLGSDLLVDSVAALSEHKAPLIIIDIGTATTLCVVNEKKQYIGGMVMPGLRTGLNSLVTNTSLLQQISLEPPKKVIGSNTIDAMKSGILYGHASMLDGMIDRAERELGKKCTIVATGIPAKKLIPFCRHDIVIDENLMLKGLRVIYRKNP
ncbi:MAG: type III pantothenate kinase [Lachnospiraceae bacterium]|jgi:type III pantothenate kinase|nr:type III pantothenate kinase [Lachnospiraceae bacterium]MCI1328606.1 type III pantothenate kinase [Lachnospiraceae bacterium]